MLLRPRMLERPYGLTYPPGLNRMVEPLRRRHVDPTSFFGILAFSIRLDRLLRDEAVRPCRRCRTFSVLSLEFKLINWDDPALADCYQQCDNSKTSGEMVSG